MYVQKLITTVTALVLVALVGVGWTAYVSFAAPAKAVAEKEEKPDRRQRIRRST